MTHDDNAERMLLACLLTGHPIIDDVAEVLTGRDFYQPRNEALYDAMVAVRQTGDRVDWVTLPTTDKAYVLELATTDHRVVPAQALHYAQLVVDAALRRRLVAAGQQVVQMATDSSDVTQAAQDALQAVTAAAETARPSEGGVTVGEGLADAIDWLETPPVGADTPWPDVNDMTNGLLAGQMVTVAARPGHGKSLVAKDVGLFTARQGRAVHIATLEMSRNEYMARIIAGLAGIDLGRMLRRQMSENDWQRVGQASDVVRGLPLYLDDRERQSMAQIRAAARQTQRRYGGLGLVAIDYAQLVQAADTRAPREQQVAQISRDTKLLAKELGCPVMLLAQLNRGNTQRSDPRPMPSDLRESGALEQDSDQVWLLHRPDQYGDETRLGEVDLIVGKNRNGPAPVTIPLSFQGHYARVVSMV